MKTSFSVLGLGKVPALIHIYLKELPDFFGLNMRKKGQLNPLSIHRGLAHTWLCLQLPMGLFPSRDIISAKLPFLLGIYY